MPDATDQPTVRTKRGTLSVTILLAVVAAAGLWYVLERPETPIPPRSTEAESDAATATAADDSGTAATKAEEYVETLTDTAPETISVDKANHFVTRDHVLSLVPEDAIENVSVGELSRDESLTADTPVTVVREIEQIETAALEQLIADSGGDLDARVRILVESDETGEVTEQWITVREVLERILTVPEEPLSIIRTARYFDVMTLQELLNAETDADTSLNVIRRPYRIRAATLADLLQRKKADNPDSIFYLHTVQPTDEQGVWGIVHRGIIDNFARGMAVERGEAIETYTVEIPRNADERLDDQSSSFLGQLIDRKTRESVVYNYRDNRMGQNPDRVYPGQEIVIIDFDPEELTAIYTHFAGG